MLQISEDADSRCYQKARAKGERTFTVRSQDVTAAVTVAEWIKLNILTAPAAKLREALDDAIAMREWPNQKAAD